LGCNDRPAVKGQSIRRSRAIGLLKAIDFAMSVGTVGLRVEYCGAAFFRLKSG
jgi:hypothetical protein